MKTALFVMSQTIF